MASSRKKQDEKNLKTLRELGALLQNKYCFDCNQRGPTYVNVTIGSFVCTKCSGMLRGITPPHRVKSISMATFTNEEIDLLKSRGNDYCRRVWLGLYDGSPPLSNNDEQAVKDFMVEKYERRRYYLDPGLSKPEVTPNNTRPASTATQLVSAESKPAKVNGVVQNAHRTRPEVNRNHINNNNNNGPAVFVADFDKADIFSSTGSSNNLHTTKTQNGTSTSSFANFDNNPVFSNTSTNTTTSIDEEFSIFDLSFNDNHGPLLNQVPLFPKCSTNRWSTPVVFGNINNWNGHQNSTNSCLNGSLNNSLKGPTMPVEDKYAALKDLDNEIKSQKNLEWSSSGSNGSLYSSPTPTGSMYSSPSPQSSIFGSPSQGQFFSAFPSENANVSNPFGNGGTNWGTNVNGFQQNQPPFANPFMDAGKMNGFSQVFQPIAPFPINTMPVSVNGTNGWAQNPFKVGTTANMNSNNPFL